MVVMMMTSAEVAEDSLDEEEEVDSPDYEKCLPEVRLHVDSSLAFVIVRVMAVQPECLQNTRKPFS